MGTVHSTFAVTARPQALSFFKKYIFYFLKKPGPSCPTCKPIGPDHQIVQSTKLGLRLPRPMPDYGPCSYRVGPIFWLNGSKPLTQRVRSMIRAKLNHILTIKQIYIFKDKIEINLFPPLLITNQFSISLNFVIIPQLYY